MTAGFSATRSVRQGYIFWAFNGLGLALVIPSGQSLIADYYPATARGRAFGMLYLTGAVGAMVGTLFATNVGKLAVLSDWMSVSGNSQTRGFEACSVPSICTFLWLLYPACYLMETSMLDYLSLSHVSLVFADDTGCSLQHCPHMPRIL